MPIRRCSGLSTKSSPPSDHHAWPPRLSRFSWSRTSTRLPARASSWVATRPARPAPTTIASGVKSVPVRCWRWSSGLLLGVVADDHLGEQAQGPLDGAAGCGRRVGVEGGEGEAVEHVDDDAQDGGEVVGGEPVAPELGGGGEHLRAAATRGPGAARRGGRRRRGPRRAARARSGWRGRARPYAGG